MQRELKGKKVILDARIMKTDGGNMINQFLSLTKEFLLAIINPIEAFQVETNFISYNQSITILTHIPVMRPTSR